MFTPFILSAFTLLGLAHSQNIICEAQIDLGIVFDSSRSISIPNFKTAQKFLEDFLNFFDIGQGTSQVRVAFISYGDGVYEKDGFGLDAYKNNTEVTAAIHRIRHHAGGYTATGPGIKYMHDNFMSKDKVRPEARKVIIVITDGTSQDTQLTADTALAARNDSIIMFAVGVGAENRIGQKELINIAGDEKRVKRVKDFDSLQKIKKVLAKITCDRVCEESSIDLGIVFDSSSSVTRTDFKTAQTFLEDFLNLFDIGPGIHQIRVAFITFGLGVYKKDGFSLSTYNNNAEVTGAIHKIQHHGGTWTATGPGIKYMHDTFMTKDKVRPDAKKVIIVITDGNSQEGELTASAASAARNDNIIMFAVGVGDHRRIFQNELINIAGEESRVTRVKDYNSLQNIKEQLATKTCAKQTYFKSVIGDGN